MQEPTPQQTTGFPTVNNYYCPPQSSGNPGFQVQSHQEFPSCQWSSGLCDCCNDVSNCFITCLCPCITFGKIAEILDRGSTSCGISGALYSLILCFTGFQFLYSCFYRSKLRSQYSLQESPCNDCLVHCFCESCALCQEYRELNLRGFDMSIGWHANVERQVRMLEEQGRISETLPPIVQGCMNR